MMCVPIVSLYCDMHSLTMQRQKFTIIPDIMVTGFLSAVDSETGNPHLEARFTDADLTRKIIELNVLGGCTLAPHSYPILRLTRIRDASSCSTNNRVCKQWRDHSIIRAGTKIP